MRIPLEAELYSLHDQYFVKDIVEVEDEEVFVDVGAYTGDTIGPLMKLAEKQNVKIKKIIAFEPDEMNYRILEKAYGNDKSVQLVKKGLSNEEKVLLFTGKGSMSRVTDDVEKSTAKIEVTALDSVPDCRDATWIKMDIEGAEMSALSGAQKTILQNHPKLTIAIYHSDEDMLRIIEYIHQLVPEYRLYVRHHTRIGGETVLYAVI